MKRKISTLENFFSFILWSYLSQSSCVSPVELTDGRKAGRGRGRNQILYKSFTTLWLFLEGTPTKRQDSGFNTSETSGLQNVRFTKHHVYKTSGLQKIQLQYVWFQNVLTSKYFKTSGFKNVQYYIKITKKYRAKDYEGILVGLGGHFLVKEQQNYEEILVRSNAYGPRKVCFWPSLTK